MGMIQEKNPFTDFNSSFAKKDSPPKTKTLENSVISASKKTGYTEWAKSNYRSCKGEIKRNKEIVTGGKNKLKHQNTKRAQAFGRLLMMGTKLAGLAVVLGLVYAAKHGSGWAAAFGRSIVQSNKNSPPKDSNLKTALTFQQQMDLNKENVAGKDQNQSDIDEMQSGLVELIDINKHENQSEVQKELHKDFEKPPNNVKNMKIQLTDNVKNAIKLMKSSEDQSEVTAHLVGLTSVERGCGKVIDKSKIESLLKSPELKNNPELKEAVLQETRQVYNTSARELMGNIVWDRLEATKTPKKEKFKKHNEWQKKAKATPFTGFIIKDLISISRAVGISKKAIPNNLTRDHKALEYQELNKVVDQLVELKADLSELE